MESMVTGALIVGEVCVEPLKVAVSPVTGASPAEPSWRRVPDVAAVCGPQMASTASAGVGATVTSSADKRRANDGKYDQRNGKLTKRGGAELTHSSG